MFASLLERLAHSQRWVARVSICLLASAGLAAALAPAGAVASTRQAASPKSFFSTAENYTQLLESVFLIHRLPAWGTALGAKAGALPKLHLVDSGVAGQMTRITAEKLRRLLPQTLTEYGHLMETFVVNEVLKQASWSAQPVVAGHWRERGGEEVDLVLERADGAVAGIAVKAASQVRPGDAAGLIMLARRLGDRWLAGVVLYAGRHTASLDARLSISALPVDALWS